MSAVSEITRESRRDDGDSIQEKRMKTQRQTIYRQGDVLVASTTVQPSTEARAITDNGRVILAYGEVTGHAHEAIGVDNSDPVPAMALFEEPGGTRLLVVKREALVRHEEHDRIELPAGTYRVIRQSEYTPEAIRNVAD